MWTPLARGGGATEEGPQVAPIPPPPLRSPGHSQRPDRNQPPALTTLPKPRRAPGGSKVTAAGRSPPPKRLAPAPAAASTSATAEPPPIPRRSGAPSPGAGSRASSAASPGAGPAPLCPQDRSLGRGPSAESWGPGDRASLPGAEVSARGTGGAGAGGFISPGGVRLLTERARCTAPLQHGNAAPEGGARLRGAQGYGARGRARARRERERRMRRGSEPQRRRDETRPERGSAGRERKRTEAGGGRRGGQRDDEATLRRQAQAHTPGERSGARTRQKDTSNRKGSPQGRDRRDGGCGLGGGARPGAGLACISHGQTWPCV